MYSRFLQFLTLGIMESVSEPDLGRHDVGHP